MVTKARTLGSAVSTGGVIYRDGAIKSYDNVDQLPLNGNNVGDTAYISNSSRVYMWTGAGWFSIALINQNPLFDSGGSPEPNYTLDSSGGIPTVIQLSASDPEEIPIQWSYVASDSADLLANITQDSSVFSFISKPQAELDSNGYTTGGSFNVFFRASDGVNIASQSSLFFVLGSPYTSLTQMYNFGLPDGIYPINIPNLGPIPLRYTSYNNKGWVEVLFSSNTSFSTPIDNWVGNTNSGWDGSLGDGTRYYLNNFNNVTNNGLDYNQTSSIKLLGAGFNATDIAITSKSSVNTNGIIATGSNQSSVLPLTIADLNGTNVPSTVTALLNYFKGTGPGFHSYSEYGTGWNKAGLGDFDISLYYRSGSSNTDEWHIADGNTSNTTTYYSNIGYRTGSYGAANVGAWTSGTVSKNSVYQIDESNVLSIWLTDM